jgi:hypothetical protein
MNRVATVDQVNANVAKMLDAQNYVAPMRDAIDIIRNEESRFPPQPSRTRAKTFNTWVREVGRLPLSAFIQQSGERRKRIKTNVVLVPSEKMLAQWKAMPMTIALTGAGLLGTGTNAASYSGFVQGDAQPDFHKQTGWLTTSQAFEKHAAKIIKRFTDHAIRLANGG